MVATHQKVKNSLTLKEFCFSLTVAYPAQSDPISAKQFAYIINVLMNEVTEMSVDSFNGFGKKRQFLKTMIGSRLVRIY